MHNDSEVYTYTWQASCEDGSLAWVIQESLNNQSYLEEVTWWML